MSRNRLEISTRCSPHLNQDRVAASWQGNKKAYSLLLSLLIQVHAIGTVYWSAGRAIIQLKWFSITRSSYSPFFKCKSIRHLRMCYRVIETAPKLQLAWLTLSLGKYLRLDLTKKRLTHDLSKKQTKSQSGFPVTSQRSEQRHIITLSLLNAVYANNLNWSHVN